MRAKLFFISLSLCLILSSNNRVYSTFPDAYHNGNKTTLNNKSFYNSFTKKIKHLAIKSTTQRRVYICGGQYAKKFHSIDDCRGLINCKGAIYPCSLQEAKNEDYKYCLICWK